MIHLFTNYSFIAVNMQEYQVSKVHCASFQEFVNAVLETIELDEIKDTLVGIPGISGLSLEQRKRLITLAVELVADPSMLFIDEPTTGLDARTAAIVMRAVICLAQLNK